MRARLQKLDWPRILLELVIVTAGVLFALSLDEWMSGRKDRAEQELLLRAVRSEFQFIIEDMEREIVFRNAMKKNAQQIYALAETGARPNIATLDPMVANLLWWSSAYLTTGAVDSILVGGKLRLIENEEIRYFLAALPARLASVKQVEGNDYTTLMNMSVPYLANHADLSQLLAAMPSERPGSTEKSEQSFRYRPRAPRDHAELLNDTKFLAVVGGVYMSQENVTFAYQGLRPQLEHAIGLIDQELDE